MSSSGNAPEAPGSKRSADGNSRDIKFCIMCADMHPESAFVSHGPCGCRTFPQCVKRYLQVCTRDKRIPIRCPFCREILNTSLCLRTLRGTAEAVELESISIIHDHIKSLRYCSDPRCATPFDFEESPCSNTKVQCPLCMTVSCVSCNTKWHEGVTCEDMESVSLISKISLEKKWRKCPSCSELIEQESGCSHMQCVCGCDFCYKCGIRYKKRRNGTLLRMCICS